MQELQVMNIQMRIITEDNIDQLLSLSDSNKDLYQLSGNKSLHKYKENLKEIIRLEKVEDMNKKYPTSFEEDLNGFSDIFQIEPLQDSFVANQYNINQISNIQTNNMMLNSFYNSNIDEDLWAGGENTYQFNNNGYQGWNMNQTVPNNYVNTIVNNSMQQNFDVPVPDYKDKDGNIDYDKYFDISPEKDKKDDDDEEQWLKEDVDSNDIIQPTKGEFSPVFEIESSPIKLKDLDDDYVIKFTDKDGKTLTGTIFAIAGDTIFVENEEWEGGEGGITSEKEIKINDVIEIISSGHTPDFGPDKPPTQSGGGDPGWDGHTTPTLNSSEKVWAEYDAFHNGGGDESDEESDEEITKLKIGGNIDIKGLKTLSNIDGDDNGNNQSGGDGGSNNEKKGIKIDDKNL